MEKNNRMKKKLPKISTESEDVIHISKKLVIGISVVICIALIVGGYFGSQWMERKNAAAFVNDEAITLKELDSVYDSTPIEYKVLLTKREMLDKLIENEVLYQQAQKSGIAIFGKAADESFGSFVLKNNLNDASLQKMLDEQGVTKEEAIINYARQASIQKFLDEELFKTLSVTENDVQKYYDENPLQFKIDEQVSVRHILINDATDAETKAHAQKILGMLTNTNFCEYVRSDSKDKASIETCGEYTFSKKDSFVEEFKTFSFAQPVGTKGIVTTKYGHHIIWIVKKTPPRTIALSEAEEKIKKYLLDKKAKDAYTPFYNALAQDYTIEILYDKSADIPTPIA